MWTPVRLIWVCFKWVETNCEKAVFRRQEGHFGYYSNSNEMHPIDLPLQDQPGADDHRQPHRAGHRGVPAGDAEVNQRRGDILPSPFLLAGERGADGGQMTNITCEAVRSSLARIANLWQNRGLGPTGS